MNATHQQLANHPRMPRVGSKVANRYEIIDLIGEGGFAVVYKAQDTQLGGIVALKILGPSKSSDTAFTKRFEQEINLVRELHHHNTIKIWDAGETEWGCLYYAMELVEGEELTTLIRRTQGLPLNRIIRIVCQVLRSLGEAHRAGIVHRDLKPGNIMVCQLNDEPDYVKVLDFGIAKARVGLTKVKTQTGVVMCTPNYAAPELLRDQTIAPSTDLYALGLIMAEMVTGVQAVRADSLVDVIILQVSSDPVKLDPSLIDTPIGRIICKATSKSVVERYQCTTEMILDLHSLVPPPTVPISVFPSGPITPVNIPDWVALQETTHLSSNLVTHASEPLETKSSTTLLILLWLCIFSFISMAVAIMLQII
tara:strand:- start:52135 stop:53232 length:1098 start_codon:yes stop_codon:yes gene_type:complete